MKTTLQQFLNGQEVWYTGFGGFLYRVKFSTKYGVPHLIFKNPRGQTLSSPITPSHEAENFYNDLIRDNVLISD